MSDISSVSGETDSHLDYMFPQDDEEEVEGQERQINSTSNNLAIISQQQMQQKDESEIEFDSEDEGDNDDADSDIFDEDVKDSISQSENSSKIQNRQYNQNIDNKSSSSVSSSQNQSGQNSLKNPMQLNRQKEIQNSISNSQQSKQKFHESKRQDLNINQDEIEEESMEEEDEVSESDKESQEEEEGDEDDLFDESFLQSSANQDSQRPRKPDMNKSSEDLDLSFSAQTSNQATITYQQLKKSIQSKRKNSLKNNQTSQFGSPRAYRKNSEMLQKENSMIQVSKPSDKLKKQYRKYYELASLIPTLRNFEWYESTAFQNKLLPIKFLTAASFWFMVCSEYFPRRMVYQKEDAILQEIRSRLDKMYMDIINRTGKLNLNNKSASNINLYTNQSYSNLQNDDNKSEDSLMQKNKQNFFKSSNNMQQQENDYSNEENNINESNKNINKINLIENKNEKSEIHLEKRNEFLDNNNKQDINNFISKLHKENNNINGISKIDQIIEIEKQFNEKQNNQVFDSNKLIINQVTIETIDKIHNNQKFELQTELSGKKNSEEIQSEKNHIQQEQINDIKTNTQSFNKSQQSSYFHKLASFIQDFEESSTTIREQSHDSNSKQSEQKHVQQMIQEENGQKKQPKEDNTPIIKIIEIESNNHENKIQNEEKIKKEQSNQKCISQKAQEEIFSEKIQEQQHLLLKATSQQPYSKFRYNSSQEMRENCINHKEKNTQMDIENLDQQENFEQKNDLMDQHKINNKFEILDQQIDNVINQHQIRELSQVKINYMNKHQYTFEDEVYIIQNRLFLLESLDYFKLIEEASSEEKLISLQQLDLEKIINLLTIQYQNEQDKNNQELDCLRQRMKKDFDEERRINDSADLDFTDILIDLNTMNPVEQEYIKFLESKQQLDYNQSIQFMQQQAQLGQDVNSDQNIVGQQSSKSAGSTKQVQIKHNEETRCQVCNECDYADNDLIVFCSVIR